MQPIIRPAQSTDIAGILEIYNDAILNTTAVYTYEARPLDWMEQWFVEKQDKGLPVFVGLCQLWAIPPLAGLQVFGRAFHLCE
jgi:L-amino acid N-acyltransferase YncA